MPHIHELIDFTISAYVVFKDRVLLIDHKLLKKWLPLGGHIELDEDTDVALIREVKEESGLDVEIIAEIPNLKQKGTKFLYTPEGINMHDINKTHKHIDLIYFCLAKTGKISLAVEEHNNIRWFTKADLDDPLYKLEPSVKHYGKQALQKLSDLA